MAPAATLLGRSIVVSTSIAPASDDLSAGDAPLALSPDPSDRSGRGGGPGTAAGKATSSRNATRHGVYSSLPVIAGVERHEDWDTHRQGVLQSLAPTGHLEESLAERAALLLWRLQRIARYETEAANLAQEAAAADALHLDVIHDRDDATRNRYAADLPRDPEELREHLHEHRLVVDTVAALPRLKDQDPIPDENASAVLYAIAEAANAPDVEQQVTAAHRARRDEPQWTAIRFRNAMGIAAGPAGNLEGRLKAVFSRAAGIVDAAQRRLDRLDACTTRLRRERLLPPPDAVDRVVRYEAHLHRLLTSTLHELEALQSRRRGDPAPLARLDVSGDPAAPADSSLTLPWRRTSDDD